MRFILFLITSVFSASLYGQGCCSGGCANPIAGGASPGVLLEKQMEIGTSFQYINGNKFLAKDKDTSALFDNFNSQYIYSRIGYGVTKNLTVSVETGYFINKSQMGLNKIDSARSSGFGDLIIFPKYDVYNQTDEKRKIEFTLGLGYKIPLGKHSDSTFTWYDSVQSIAHYTISPPLVQPTTGSQDIILYAFFFRGFPQKNFRLFANTTYIKKGWNSSGEKFGDYASIGLFAGKTFFKSLGITLQLKAEWVDKMQYNTYADKLIGGGNSIVALYNIDIRSTGSKKIFFAPQLSYNYKSFALYAMYEIPVYQYVNGAQVSTSPFTIGLSYKFFTSKGLSAKTGETIYRCPMKCEGGDSKEPGKCRICGMELMPETLPK